ncbi:macrolide family glycosyltransferase [Streptomyces europaeiscabiei]|uniref:macrolide family glycosyltransferase n=1 Tax=Streptomyces europaeiscabiei TaxID=146819 RepID=UPI002E0E74A3|nr:glycosyl transferase [Streptomyces europaeiscabiei]
MKKHLAFVSQPAQGHINPTIPLVKELVRRGHRVSYATGEPMCSTVRAAGATAIQLPSRQLLNAPVEFTPEALSAILDYYLADARITFPVLISHFEKDRPDAVCYDMVAFTGRMLAQKLSVPDIALIPSLAANERSSVRNEFKPATFPKLIEFGQNMQALAAECGLILDAMPTWGMVASLNLVFIPREFQLDADTFDQRFHFLGPSPDAARERSHDWRPPVDQVPMLFVSLGTTTFNQRRSFFRMCIRAFAESPWHVVMAIGERVCRDSIGEVPRNFEISPYFPQLEVLSHARVFLSHAGMNSIMESLYCGVPLVMLPQMPEQEANARRVEDLRLGRRLVPAEVTVEVLRKTVAEVDRDPGLRTNLAQMKRLIRNCGGAVLGADVIEAHLA